MNKIEAFLLYVQTGILANAHVTKNEGLRHQHAIAALKNAMDLTLTQAFARPDLDAYSAAWDFLRYEFETKHPNIWNGSWLSAAIEEIVDQAQMS